MQVRIVLLGVDQDQNRILTLYLNHAGYQVKECQDLLETVSDKDSNPIDLCILDFDRFTISELDNVKRCRSIYPESQILVTGNSNSSIERILCLESGASDYVEKPYALREIVLRIERILSTGTRFSNERKHILKLHGYILDENCRIVYAGDTAMRFTSKEFDLLCMFARHIGHALSREQILDFVWGSHSFCNDRVVDDLVRRVRMKLPELRIESIYGYGYRA